MPDHVAIATSISGEMMPSSPVPYIVYKHNAEIHGLQLVSFSTTPDIQISNILPASVMLKVAVLLVTLHLFVGVLYALPTPVPPG